MVKELYISVDVEADGPIPGPYSMTALGAVAAGFYDSATNNITRLDVSAPVNRFYAELAPISDQWEPEAMKVGLFSGFGKEAAANDPTGVKRRAYIEKNGQYAAVVMTDFNDWVKSLQETYGITSVVFGAYPLGYDWMWTYWYLINFTNFSPFGHSRHYDMKTGFAERARKPITGATKRNMPRHLMSKLPHTHLAVDDAAEQGEMFMNILEWEGVRP